jgi:hypothetical protein
MAIKYIYQKAAIYLLQIAIKYTNIFHSKALPKFNQIGILGMKKYHLATLLSALFPRKTYLYY